MRIITRIRVWLLRRRARQLLWQIPNIRELASPNPTPAVREFRSIVARIRALDRVD